MICIHHNDLDGRAAAAIVGLYMKLYKENEKVEFIETNYNQPLPDIDLLIGQDVVIVDFSYEPQQFNIIYAAAKSVTWIDHHKTAAEYPYGHVTLGLRDFGDKNRAGCELTWNFFFPNDPMPAAIRLIGDYDKWALKMKHSKAFHEGMKLESNGPEAGIWKRLLHNDHSLLQQPLVLINEIIDEGNLVMKYRDEYCKSICHQYGFETEIAGFKAYACNIYGFGSQAFGDLFDQYPLCIAFIRDKERFTVSLYSQTVDVGEIARKFGGGGHKGAAGFVCKDLPFVKSFRKLP